MPNGNIVVTDFRYSIPDGQANVGAVYLYSSSGAFISMLTGSTTNDQVGSGGITVLANGNYVIYSHAWRFPGSNDDGAVTFGDAETGVSGVVSAANSLVGTQSGDNVGSWRKYAIT